MADVECDILIVGGGTGGCAAALAAYSLGMRVIMTEPTTMIGGQLTSQMVPPDEHPWIEEFGCTARYRDFRSEIRKYYASLTGRAKNLSANPGGGWVSRLCYEPLAGVCALSRQLEASNNMGGLEIWLNAQPSSVTTGRDAVEAVRIERDGFAFTVLPRIVLDATELGELLPLAASEYRTGSESQDEYGERHATAVAEPENVQAFTWCFALGYRAERPWSRPKRYDLWKGFRPTGWPGPLFSFTFPDPITGRSRTLPLFSSDPDRSATLFRYRQIIAPAYEQGVTGRKPVTAVNWPQNDYLLGSILDVPKDVVDQRLMEAKELGRCLVYWLRTEAPRHDGGEGYPELGTMPSVSFTADGFAMAPYHRESRRMVTRFTVTEQMVAADCNPGLDRAPAMPKSVGVGYYRIDLHPSANGRGYIDIPSLPFQIPLGALIPVRLRNLLPACKNLGVTHITNGCYRLHPVEWNIGEAAGLLAAFCVTRNTEPAAVYESESLWLDFERLLHAQGVETAWPAVSLALPG